MSRLIVKGEKWGGLKMIPLIRECDTVMLGLGAWLGLGLSRQSQVSIGIRDRFLG